MKDAVATYVDRFLSLPLNGGGCTDAEIEMFESTMRLPLPAAYRAYLLLAGGATPSALVGSDCTLNKLPSLQVGARELLCENGQPPLEPGALVFLMHQGYQFFYFVADANNDDPPVFYYLEGQPGVVKRFERFSDFMAVFFTVQDTSG